MTDPQAKNGFQDSLEFEAFSQMLDEELDGAESALSAGGAEAALLLELRHVLRHAEPQAEELPGDFAHRTAALVQERHRALSPLTRGLRRLDPVLQRVVLSRSALPWGMLLGAATAGSYLMGWCELGLFGVALLSVSLPLGLLAKLLLANPRNLGAGPRTLPEIQGARVGAKTTKIFFYALPALATLLTAAFAGSLLSSLATFSVSFKTSGANLGVAGVAAAAIAFLFLINSLSPTWAALAERSERSRAWRFGVQLLHGLWASGTLIVLVRLRDAVKAREQNVINVPPSQAWSAPGDATAIWVAGVVLAVLAGLAIEAARRPAPEKRPLGRALRRTLPSLLVGGTPIVLVLVGFYQLNLTREISNPADYQKVRETVAQWSARQRAIPADQNGWTDLKEFMLRQNRPTAQFNSVHAGFKGGGEIHEYWVEHSKNSHVISPQDARRKAEAARVAFLRELPRIEKAVAMPKFSYVSTQGFDWKSLVPNFIICRAVSQGLAGLAVRSSQEGDDAEALHYTVVGLKWATKVREGALINLMISVAQLSIAVEDIERFVLENHLSKPQLQTLLRALLEVDLPSEAYSQTMEREMVMLDNALREHVVDGTTADRKALYGSMFDKNASVIALLLPKSYWESERKAYINYELSQLTDWRNLSRPAQLGPEEFLPLGLATQEIVPNTTRAQAQFMLITSKLSALQQVVALELFQRDHGRYPAELEELVPAYLQALPVDPIHPNLWTKKPTFTYKTTSKGYELISESPVYEQISMSARQVYGHDGKPGWRRSR